MDAPDELRAFWARGGLDGLATAPTLRATITARTLLAAVAPPPDAAHADAAASVEEVAGRLSPELAGTLPTLPALDFAAEGAPSADRAEFAVSGVLGEGGMGRVLVARQRSLARDVALKVRRPEAPLAAGTALLSEARIMGHLEHPSIVPVHALGRDADGSPVIVMKRIDGVPWSTLVAEPSHPAWAKLATVSRDRRTAHVEILVAVCNAVQFAHSRGVVHRDLKPDNVMVGEFGEVYVTDWGIALPLAAVPAGEPTRFAIVGTPVYMAPEMVTGDPRRVDARTDVYLLGAIVHEILTGGSRNAGDSLRDVLLAAYEPAPVAYGADVPEELAAIANRATAARPEDRFPDAQAVQRALVDYLHHRGSNALEGAARGALAALDEAIATPPRERSAEAAAHVERLGTECRFGFLQALRAWPENRAASEGHATCLATLVSDHLARGDAHGARALIRELDAPPAGLLQKLEVLEAENARSAREHQDLARRAHEMDPAVGGAERTRMIGIGVGGSLLLSAFAALRLATGDGGITVYRIAFIPLVILVIAVVAIAARARFLASQFNRRAGLILVVGLLMVFAHRVFGAHAGDAVTTVLRGDALILAAVFFTAGATQHGVLAAAGAPLLVVAAAMPTNAASAGAAFGAAVALAAAIATVGSALISRKR